ncbi:hypothetical protein BIW11_06455 [Tropilaelaps mercedesae]|uniref:Uncharacterized protein n=1 Tax=Tropilaelaps mercedesae TaxID=418985 RepID=A0A1V9XY30_9ACAR|nr:hypothetical protein BIW11_06455 [Tropilaelaps mercedesae]
MYLRSTNLRNDCLDASDDAEFLHAIEDVVAGKKESKHERILIETGGPTIPYDDDFGISDLQPVEETSSFSPISPSVVNADEEALSDEDSVSVQDSIAKPVATVDSNKKNTNAPNKSSGVIDSKNKRYIIIGVSAVAVFAIIAFFLAKKLVAGTPGAPTTRSTISLSQNSLVSDNYFGKNGKSKSTLPSIS